MSAQSGAAVQQKPMNALTANKARAAKRIFPMSLNSGSDHVINIAPSIITPITVRAARKTKSVAKSHAPNQFKKLLTILNVLNHPVFYTLFNIPNVRLAYFLIIVIWPAAEIPFAIHIKINARKISWRCLCC